MSEYVPVELRRRTRDTFFGCCAYCQTDEALTVAIFEIEHIVPQSSGGVTEFGKLLAALHVEHVIPIKHDGSDDDSNLALACIDCNLRKGSNLTGFSLQEAFIQETGPIPRCRPQRSCNRGLRLRETNFP